jgi:hypothetical protein
MEMAQERSRKKKYTHEADKLMACLEVGKLLTSTLDQKEILKRISDSGH